MPSVKDQHRASLLEAETFLDPYPMYRRLREAGPIHWIEEFDCWFVPGYEANKRILRDDVHFSKENTAFEKGMHPTVKGLMYTLFQDDPDHARLRSVLQKMFAAKEIAAFEQDVDAIVADAIADLDRDTEVDLLKDYAYKIPIYALCLILGLPREDYHLFEEWAPGIAQGFNPDQGGDNYEASARTFAAIRDYLLDVIRDIEKRPPKRPTVLSLLAQAKDAGTITEQELLSQAVVMYGGGHETTLNLIGLTVYALLRNPGELDKVLSNPGLLPNAVEEATRFDGPGHMVPRRVQRPLDFYGVPLAEDDSLLVGTGAANHDPEVFEAPDDFIADRDKTEVGKHLGYGHGIHFCLGAHLARLEVRIALRRLLAAFPDMQLAEAPPLRYNENLVLHGLERLPVRLEP